MKKPCYFMISVSNQHNLELCIKYALAGFTNSIPADQTTLQNVSQMGSLWKQEVESLQMPDYKTFVPKFSRQQKNIPLVFPFQEVILQAAIRQYLSDNGNLANLIRMLGLASSLQAEELEVLSEKATSEGHVDILVKDRAPVAVARKVIIEVKLRRAQKSDLEQLKRYKDEFGEECLAGVLIAGDFPDKVVREASGLPGIHLVRYNLGLDWGEPKSFAEILAGLTVEEVTLHGNYNRNP